MQLDLDTPVGDKSYVARTHGLHAKYRLEREFEEATERTLHAGKGMTRRTRRTYQLSDGLYEISKSDDREYLAIVANRRVMLLRCRLQGVR